MQALDAKILIQVQRDFAIGPSTQTMPALFKFSLDRFMPVEFAVHDDASTLILASDRLISSCKVNNAKSRMAQSNSLILCDPVPLRIGTSVIETLGGS